MTMITLAIEASTYAGSAAVIRDGIVVVERDAAMRGEREERLMPAVAEALREASVEPRAIARIACGAGPGSFTSLRIAAAIAKGLALAANTPVYPVSSLWLIVAGAQPALAPGRYVAVLDAMRGDVFAALFVVADSGITTEEATTILPRGELAVFARERAARLVGPGEAIVAPPHARGVALLGTGVPWPPAADLASWEPEYGRVAEAQRRWEAAHGESLTPRRFGEAMKP